MTGQDRTRQDKTGQDKDETKTHDTRMSQAGCLLALDGRMKGLLELVLPPVREGVVVSPFANGQDLRCVVEGQAEWATLTDWDAASGTYTLALHRNGREGGGSCLDARLHNHRPLPTRFEIAPLTTRACHASLNRIEQLTFGQTRSTGIESFCFVIVCCLVISLASWSCNTLH